MPNWPISSSEAAAFLASRNFWRSSAVPDLASVPIRSTTSSSRHADAVVADGQRARLLVHLDLDVQIGGVDVEVLVPQRSSRSLSSASEALEISSRRNESLLEYTEWIIRSSS